MLQLKEIAEFKEFKNIKETYGDIEDYLKEKSKPGIGFIDPIYYSPRREEVYDYFRQHSLKEMLGGGTGSDFMSYMIPTKVYQVLYDAFREENILPDISGLVVQDFEGGTVNVNWGLIDKIKPKWGTGPGAGPISTEEVNKVQITPKTFSMDMAIARDFIEDNAHDIIEYHIRATGKEMANFAVAEALETMYAGRDTNNNVAGGTNAITVANGVSAVGAVDGQGGMPDTCVLTRAMVADLIGDTTTFNLALQFKEAATRYQIMPGFLGLKWFDRVVSTSNGLYDTVNADYYALVFEKARTLAVAWKRPITIESYTSPREGLAGAFASGRVGFGVMHDGDFISAILEGD